MTSLPDTGTEDLKEVISSIIDGTWELANWQHYENGEAVSHPFGEDAHGLIMYDKTSDSEDGAGGYMSGFLARSNWPQQELNAISDYVGNFFSYGGTWTLQDIDGQPTMHHGVEFASYPPWVGGVQVRQATWDGEFLHLDMRDEKTSNPAANLDRLTWRKRG